MKKILIVPSIRQNSLDRFISEWAGVMDPSVNLLIMEDNPTNTLVINKSTLNIARVSWEDIDRSMASPWIIPRRSDTVRSFAYFYAGTSQRADFLFTLDDDCYPDDSCADIVGAHIDALVADKSRWFNTLNSGKPRGIPYFNVGSRRVVLNHGLWTNVLDYDAPTQLASPFDEQFSFDNRIVPSGQYFPMCGMNVAWDYDVTVLMYHLLMGCVDINTMPRRHADNVKKYCLPASNPGSAASLYQLPFDRFGDIWCGVIMKKVVDHLGLAVSSGTPYIRHDRASNPFVNLVKESKGMEINETFWERVDGMALDPIDKSKTVRQNAVACYDQLGSQVRESFVDTQYSWYFDMLGDAMCIWAELFSS